MSQQAIIDELLSYSEELRLAYDTCQLLLYHYRTKQANRFFDLLNHLDKDLPAWFIKYFTQLDPSTLFDEEPFFHG